MPWLTLVTKQRYGLLSIDCIDFYFERKVSILLLLSIFVTFISYFIRDNESFRLITETYIKDRTCDMCDSSTIDNGGGGTQLMSFSHLSC